MRYRLRTLLILATMLAVPLAGWFFRGYILQSFPTGVRYADKIALYEGLPHQLYEVDLLEQQRRTKAVQDLSGYPFYQEPLELNDEDAKRLVAVLGNPASFQSFTIEKPCGGFHPDYAVDFRYGFARYLALICFGCGEAKLIGPWSSSRNDLDETARQKLADILHSYHKNRPIQQARS
jgi:hypothetical protein